MVCGSLQKVSANRSALEEAKRTLIKRADVHVYEELGLLPPFNPDVLSGPVVEVWREALHVADAVVFASPEYAGSIAGTLKNALDWIVGSGELYGTPVAVLSAGTSGGEYARRALIQTLTWQGAHVVAELGIAAPRTKVDALGVFVDVPTVDAIAVLADMLCDAVAMPNEMRLRLVTSIVDAAGVDLAHIAPMPERSETART